MRADTIVGRDTAGRPVISRTVGTITGDKAASSQKSNRAGGIDPTDPARASERCWFNSAPPAANWPEFLMRSVEITRAGDQSIEDQLGGMRSWLDREGIRVTDLHAVRILNARVTFTATFERAAEADRFVGAFGDLD